MGIHDACMAGDAVSCAAYIDQHHDVNAREPVHGRTPLHFAAMSGSAECCQLLLECGATNDLRDKNGLTPLHVAILADKAACATVLLDKGADINALSLSGKSPLHAAVSSNASACTLLLLRRGADINIPNTSGQTPLHAAVMAGNKDGVALLVDYGANLLAEDNFHDTPLHTVARLGDVACATSLLDALARTGRNVEIRNKFGRTPLDLARQKGHTEMSLMLVRHRNDHLGTPGDYTDGPHPLVASAISTNAASSSRLGAGSNPTNGVIPYSPGSASGTSFALEVLTDFPNPNAAASILLGLSPPKHYTPKGSSSHPANQNSNSNSNSNSTVPLFKPALPQSRSSRSSKASSSAAIGRAFQPIPAQNRSLSATPSGRGDSSLFEVPGPATMALRSNRPLSALAGSASTSKVSQQGAEVESLKKAVEELRVQLHDTQVLKDFELDRMQQQLEAAEAELATARAERNAAQAAHEEAATQYEATVAELSAQLQQLADARSSEVGELANANGTLLKQLRQVKGAKDGELDELRKEKSQLQKKASQLEKDLASHEASLEHRAREAEAMKGNIKELKERLDMEVAERRRERDRMAQEMHDYGRSKTAELTTVERTAAALREKIVALESEMQIKDSALDIRNSEREMLLKQLDEARSAQDAEVALRKKEVDQCRSDLASLKEAHERDTQSWKRTRQDMQERIIQLESMVTTKNAELDARTREREQLVRQFTVSLAIKDSERDEMRRTTQEITKKSIDDLRIAKDAEIDRLQQQTREFEQKLAELESQRAEMEARAEQLDRLRTEAAELRSCREELGAIRQSLLSKDGALEERRRQNDELESSRACLQAHIRELEAALKSKEQDVADRAKDGDVLQEQLNSISKSLQAEVAERRKMESAVQELEGRLERLRESKDGLLETKTAECAALQARLEAAEERAKRLEAAAASRVLVAQDPEASVKRNQEMGELWRSEKLFALREKGKDADDLRAKMAEMEQRMTALQQENAELVDKIQDGDGPSWPEFYGLQEEVRRKEETIIELETEVETLREDLEESQDAVRRLDGALQGIKAAKEAEMAEYVRRLGELASRECPRCSAKAEIATNATNAWNAMNANTNSTTSPASGSANRESAPRDSVQSSSPGQGSSGSPSHPGGNNGSNNKAGKGKLNSVPSLGPLGLPHRRHSSPPQQHGHRQQQQHGQPQQAAGQRAVSRASRASTSTQPSSGTPPSRTPSPPRARTRSLSKEPGPQEHLHSPMGDAEEGDEGGSDDGFFDEDDDSLTRAMEERQLALEAQRRLLEQIDELTTSGRPIRESLGRFGGDSVSNTNGPPLRMRI